MGPNGEQLDLMEAMLWELKASVVRLADVLAGDQRHTPAGGTSRPQHPGGEIGTHRVRARAAQPG
mgnify:CR=1 FL=1